MKFLILGAGGIGSYFGARLLNAGNEVIFVARGKHLIALQQNGLKLQHPEFYYNSTVFSDSIENIIKFNPFSYDAVIITTKSTSTPELAKQLQNWFADYKKIPYIISLQNGIKNEEILSQYFDPKDIIGGLTRKIGAHIVSPSYIKAVGNAETILGLLHQTKENKIFLKKLQNTFNNAQIPTYISENIHLELWKKLVINNGVNALCTLLKVKTGTIMNHDKLKKIVYGLMVETSIAAKNKGIIISKEDIDEMFELIKHFDSIKPSMLIDREFKRVLELEDICGVVIKNCEEQNLDAPYTRTISTLLDYIYCKE